MILFIVALGILLGALHWGKQYVANLRAEQQTASVKVRWRKQAKNEPQLLIFAHALLFSTYAGLIGRAPLSSAIDKPGLLAAMQPDWLCCDVLHCSVLRCAVHP